MPETILSFETDAFATRIHSIVAQATMRSIGIGETRNKPHAKIPLITNNKLQEIEPPAMGSQQLIEIGEGTNYINRTLRLPARYIIL
jgi:hypothetical protein